MRVAIVGAGYVGLVTGACLADLGYDVTCIDHDKTRINLLQVGTVPFHEPGLEALVRCNQREGRLHFTTQIPQGVEAAEVVFICVGTPPTAEGEADLTAVESVVRDIGLASPRYRVIVEKSTVPVQTGAWLKELAEAHLTGEFDIACNPEFLAEGSAIQDFLRPDRIVIGTNSDRAAQMLVQLYTPLNAPLLITDIESAELIKHASNAFLALKISFINAVAQVCERTGADVERVARGIGLDKRIGERFLKAGIGYGGACFPKDVAAFIQLAAKSGYDFQLLKAVAEINQFQRQHFLAMIRQALGPHRRTVTVLGLSFKPQTDDIRESPALAVIHTLLAEGVSIRAYDPVAMEATRKVLPRVAYHPDPYSAADGTDVLAIATDWPQFRHLDLVRLRRLMARPVLVDGRNLYEPSRMAALGYDYYSMGRAPVRSVSDQFQTVG